MEARRAELRASGTGIEPEFALVIETIGSAQSFLTAVRHTKGLEWLADIELDDIEPDQAFLHSEDRGDPDKKAKGRLYLVMTDRAALGEMLSLWRGYRRDSEMVFGHGKAGFRDIFRHIHSIRWWGVRDRLDSELVRDWEERLDRHDETIRLEVELWYRQSEERRREAAEHVRALVGEAGGQIIGESTIPQIAYQGMLAELPAASVRSAMRALSVEDGAVQDPGIKLVRSEQVMFFRAVGQMVVGEGAEDEDPPPPAVAPAAQPLGEPVVALFDGLPLANHPELSGRLIIDNDDDWAEEGAYEARHRKHGTAMASLIAHGDLDNRQPPLSRSIYVRPVMKPLGGREGLPEDCLSVDLIHSAVKRMLEGGLGEEARAPQVRVINLSIGDMAREFVQFMSPLARLLDWLSEKHQVLFVVSAGNHIGPIGLESSPAELSAQPEKLYREVMAALHEASGVRRLLSPAETVNGLTVGAFDQEWEQLAAPPGSPAPPDFYGPDGVSLLPPDFPSPISSFGGGHRRAIKPDLVFYGGRQRYTVQSTGPLVVVPTYPPRKPYGHRTAFPKGAGAQSYSRSCGTSNAAALLSRQASICYDSLQEVLREQIPGYLPGDLEAYEAPLLKAMLVHGCEWGASGAAIRSALEDLGKGSIREFAARWIGNGLPELDRVLECTPQRATLLGYGSLEDGKAHVYSLPIPGGLGSVRVRRHLTVTLAWLSPVHANTQRYRAADLWFKLDGNAEFVGDRTDVDGRTVGRGTLQHEVFSREAASVLDDEALEIKVNCREDIEKALRGKSVRYGLVVSLRVQEGVDIPIYDEIRSRIAPLPAVEV